MPTLRQFSQLAGALFVVSVALPTAADAAACSDPWVTQLTTKYLGHPPSSPNAPQCNIYLYHNGHWNSYAELDAAVAARYSVNADPDPAGRALASGSSGRGSMPSDLWTGGATRGGFADVLTMSASSFSGAAIGSRWQINGKIYELISNDGSSVTLRIVAQGGGNIVSTNGNNRHP